MEQNCLLHLIHDATKSRVDAERFVAELVYDVERLEHNVSIIFAWMRDNSKLADKLLRNYLPAGYDYAFGSGSQSEIFRELVAHLIAPKVIRTSSLLLPSGLDLSSSKQSIFYYCKERRLLRLISLVARGLRLLKICVNAREEPDNNCCAFPFQKKTGYNLLFGFTAQGKKLKDNVTDAFILRFCDKVNDYLGVLYKSETGRIFRNGHRDTETLRIAAGKLEVSNEVVRSLLKATEDEVGEQSPPRKKQKVTFTPVRKSGGPEAYPLRATNPATILQEPLSPNGSFSNGEEVAAISIENSSCYSDSSGELTNSSSIMKDVTSPVRRSQRIATKMAAAVNPEDEEGGASVTMNSNEEGNTSVNINSSNTKSQVRKKPAAVAASSKVFSVSFPENFRLKCAQVAGNTVVTKLRAQGKPLDFILPSGKEIHHQFRGPGKPSAEDGGVEIDMVELRTAAVTGDCPFVVVFRHGWSSWLRDLVMKEANSQLFIHDTKSNGGKSVLSCSFVDGGNKDGESSENDGSGRLPFLKLGHSHGIQSIPATRLKKLMLSAQSELVNLFIDETNLLLQEARCLREKEYSFNTSLDRKSINFLKKHAVPNRNIDSVLLDEIPRQINNICIEKKGKFGRHSDACSAICRRECGPTPVPSCFANGATLPTRQDLAVCTNVFGEGRGSMQGVAWLHKDTKLGSIYTLDRCCHLQFIGCNALDIEHAVDNSYLPASQKKEMKNCVPTDRMTSTARMVYHPTNDKEAYEAALRDDKLSAGCSVKELSLYNMTNVFGNGDPIRKRGVKPKEVHRATSLAPTPPWQLNDNRIGTFKHRDDPKSFLDNLTRKEFEEHFGTGKHALYQMAQLAGPKKQLKQTLVMNSRLNTCAFDYGYLIHNQESRMQPLWTIDGKLCYPGTELQPARIPNTLSKQSSEIINSQAKNFLLLLEKYKNDPDSTSKHFKFGERCQIAFSKSFLAKKTENSLRKQFDSLPPLTICGCGGSTQPSGTYTPTASSSGPSDYHITLGYQQDLLTDSNKTLVECYNLQNAVHVALDVSTWASDEKSSNKKKAGTKKESATYLSIGYMQIKSIRTRKLNMDQLQERFKDMPDYLSDPRNVYNVNFLLQGYWEFELEHAFSFSQYIEMFHRSSQQFSYKHLNIMPNDRTALVVPTHKLQEKDHEGHYVHQDIIDWYTNPQQKQEFLESIPSDVNPLKREKFFITIAQFFAVLLAVSGACAMRSDHKHCTKILRRGKKEEHVAVPLHGELASKMTMPMRMTPMPHPNGDLDPGVVFTGHCMQELYRLLQSESHCPILEAETQCSYSKPDLSHAANVTYLTDCLFMAMSMRLTGSITALGSFSKFMGQCYPKEKLRELNLPTVKLGRHFAEFIQASDKEMSQFLSNQHRKSLPSFMEKKEDFVNFLHNCCTHELGFRRISNYIEQCGKLEQGVDRKELIQRIKLVMCSCGAIESSDELSFLVSKIVSDVEAVLLDFAGEVTFDSVTMGKGAREGVVLVQLDEKLEENEKFRVIHRLYLEFLKLIAENERNALGWKGEIRNGRFEVVSIRTGRRYSYQDTEHALCKLWLAARAAHCSRNTAKEVNRQTKPHCFPLANKSSWLRSCCTTLSHVLKAYATAKDNERFCEIPSHYDIDISRRR